MKKIFNSLGSNYSWPVAQMGVSQLLRPTDFRLQLKQVLEKKYGGEAFLVYKGRDAIELALLGLGIGAGDEVITQAFTCCAIETAIERVGAKPVFVDISKESLNPELAQLDRVLSLAVNPKALIIQNTLGRPADMKEVAKWAKKHQIMLIEDLAQSVGGEVNGQELGSFGDVIILSFGQDKVLDAVNGGVVIFKKPLSTPLADLKNVPSKIIGRDMLYPLVTQLVRDGFDWGWGRLVFKVAVWLQIIKSPAGSPTSEARLMPAAHSGLAWQSWQGLKGRNHHRQQIAQVYIEALSGLDQFKYLKNWDLATGAWQRLPLILPQKKDVMALLAHLKNQGYFFTDRWYRQAVDCGSVLHRTSYKSGSCPVAEEISQTMINLPTHQYVSENDAKNIANLIKDFYRV